MSLYRLQIRLNVRGERGYHGNIQSFLPVNVVDARGQVLSTGTVNTLHVTEFQYERDEAPLFVRLTLPNGTTETQPLLMPDRVWRDEVEFSIGEDAATSAQMAWSAMRLDMKRHGGALLSQPGMKDAWFQLWEKTNNSPRWQQVSMEDRLENLLRSPEAIQLDLWPTAYPRALVVRLDSDTPQVVSLPRENTSVLVTSLRTLSGMVTPRVVVGGYSPNAEAIMEFLRAGKLGQVEAMLDPGSGLAHQLLRDKHVDAIAATAAAYYLLRKRDWNRMPSQWLDTLADRYIGIPDAKLIRATSQIERGMPMHRAANLAVETLSGFLDHGIPMFAEANFLLSDLLALAEKAERPLDTHTAKTFRMMLASSRPAGLSFGFAGKAPDRPMAPQLAFERQQEVRGEKLLLEAARKRVNLRIFEPARFSPAVENKPLRLQFRDSVKNLRLTGDMLVATPRRRAVSGSAAKTLFLQNVLDEA